MSFDVQTVHYGQEFQVFYAACVVFGMHVQGARLLGIYYVKGREQCQQCLKVTGA